MDLITGWGLQARVIGEGEGWVKAPGVYRVGAKISRRETGVFAIRKFSIEESGVSWLERRFKKRALNLLK